MQAQRENRGAIESELLAEDPSFLDIVIPFVDGLSDRLLSMEQAIRATDFEALRSAAHQLKGSGGGHGFPDLTTHAAALEQHAKRALVDDCINELEELREVVSRIYVPTE